MKQEVSVETSNRFLSVEKRIENHEQDRAIVAFTITATSDVPVAFRLVDTVPSSTSPSDVGFHPDYKFDHWTVYEEGRVALSDTTSPGETLEAFYYLDTEIDSAQLHPPTIDETTPIEAETTTADGPPTWRCKEAVVDAEPSIIDGPLPTTIKGDAPNGFATSSTDSEDTSQPAGEADDAERTPPRLEALVDTNVDDADRFAELQEEHDQEEYVEFRGEVEQHFADEVDFKELITEGEEQVLPAESPPSTTDEPREAPRASDEDESPEAFEDVQTTKSPAEGRTVLARLFEELEAHELSEGEQKLLRDKLGLTTPHHTTVRMRHLQSKVADLTAYIDSLEAFLDNKGTAREVFDAFEDDLDRVQSRLDQLEATVNDADEHRAARADRIGSREDDVEAARQLQTDVEQLREQASYLTARLDEVESQIERVEQQLEVTVEPLENTVCDNDDRIADLQDSVQALQDQYETIRRAFTQLPTS